VTSRGKLVPWAVAAASLLFAAIVLVVNVSSSPAPHAPSPSPSPTPGRYETALRAETLEDLPVTMRPYPYTTPTPAPAPTEIDGTYMLILTLDDLGGTEALPFPCRRCLPYARDPGVVTLIFFRGAYFLDHQMSGFHGIGHYELDGNRIELFNDPSCSHVHGTYTWELEGGQLRLTAVEDPCAYQGERATDLTSSVWTRIPICRREVVHLWPGILGCE